VYGVYDNDNKQKCILLCNYDEDNVLFDETNDIDLGTECNAIIAAWLHR
jgi:hypothetical protein